MKNHIRVIIADDHTIVRSGIRLLLETDPQIEVIGEAVSGEQVLEQIEKNLPDVVLMDIAMPGMDGLEATRKIKTRWPNVYVLVLTMHRSDEYFFEMLKAGASGYILKGAETNDLLQAIHVVSRGEVFLLPAMTQKLLMGYITSTQWEENAGASLTKREKEILRLLSDGYCISEIAEMLVVSPSTVHSHQGNLMSKLGLNSRHELVQFARQHGLTHDI